MRRFPSTVVAASSVFALALTGCSTKASDSGGSGSADGLKTDFGVTDSEISLLTLDDLSGVFKVNSLAYEHGIGIWADEVNAAGGICDRDITINAQDTAYKVDNALPIFEQEKANSLGIISVGGSHILAALKPKLEADNVATVPASWASVNLDLPQLMMIGQTYDIEMLNGLSYLQEQGMIADGDTIGHIYVDSEYGQNALLGSQAYAEQNGMTVADAKIASTDTDMTAIVAKLKSEGVSAIAITTPPDALGSAALQNQSQGLGVPMIGSNPVFSPTLLEDESVTAALENYYQISSYAPVASDVPAAQEILKKLQSDNEDEPHIGSIQGYVWGLAWGELLEKACDNGDMTRAGIMEAKKSIDSLETDGLTGPLNFSVEGSPTTRQAIITQADPDAPGRLTTVQDLFESESAKSYKAPHEK